MGVEVVSKGTFHRLARGNFSPPSKPEVFRLCLSDGKPAVLSRLKSLLGAAVKAGAPVDLHALRRMIVELEGLTDDEITQRLTHPETIRIYRIPPPPTLEEEELLIERERADRKRRAQEWLDAAESDRNEDPEESAEDPQESAEDEGAFL